MDEDEEDKHLFSRLGVTSANPEDIELDLLKVDNDGAESSQKPEAVEENNKDASSSIEIMLRKKLRAINVEINAVASTIGHGKPANASEGGTSDTDFTGGDGESGNDFLQRSSEGYSVQKAVATERLISLEKTKGQLQFEIDKLNNDASLRNHGNNNLITNLVKELPKKKEKAKESNSSVRAPEQRRIAFAEDDDFDAVMDAAATGFAETERDELIRKGFLTPFHKLKGFERRVQLPEPAVKAHMSTEDDNENIASSSIAKVAQSISDIAKARPTTILLDSKSLPALDGPTHPFQRLKTPLKRPASPESVSEKKKQKGKKLKRPLPDRKWIKRVTQEGKLSKGTGEYEREKPVPSDSNAEYPEELEDSDSGRSCVVLEGGLKIPEGIFSNLFDYQRIGVQWLWELHCQRAGGIIGDEMGLGKTVQVISFLASLHFSGMYKPSIVICPVTLLRQWQREACKWYPKFDVEILHDSARCSIAQQPSKSSESDYDSEDASLDNENGRVVSGKSNKRWDCLIDRVLKSESGVLLTTYEQLRLLAEKLLDIEWGYAVLDEGHRIRNPNAEITLVCKQLQTVHRIIMTGAPIQNKLSELWSLFDFIFPGKLGVLPVFETEFAVPITVGGYANATPLQVSTAYRCAVVLRDLVMPYLLRRMKTDVNAQLPKKTEHVLFCTLTSDQRSIYRAFLASSDVEQIFDGSRNSLYGIDIMRKICNHPDLLEREHCGHHSDYGNPERSGKMKVVAQILGVWKEQGHRVLIFTQTQQMLDIFAKFLTASGYIYRRMDGLTPVRQRMALIDEYNNTSDIFVFILTTKVGGLGTNLTGANRVIIYDPDWNPSTDMQARERAWRIGQTKDVTIYRLITRGTIEEKVYHRQIYKHFLTNKILKNPQQKRFFKARDMRDLFTLQDDERDFSTETSTIFAQLPNEVSVGVNISELNIQNPEAASADAETANNSRTSNMKTKSKGKDIADQNGCTDNGVDVLKSLLDANGIHSALNHDAIMNANDDDRVKMEDQASLVAQKAAEALRQSRMLRGRESFALPTWTGKAGAAGAPSSVRRKFGSTLSTNIVGSRKPSSEGSSSHSPGLHAGASTGKALSSAEILARTREKQEMASTHAGFEKHSVAPSTSSSAGAGQSSGDNRSKRPNKVSIAQPEILIRQLCTFIQQHGGSADSSSIVLHFKESILPKDLPIFRSLLKEIALLEKGVDGARWVLKPEYRD